LAAESDRAPREERFGRHASPALRAGRRRPEPWRSTAPPDSDAAPQHDPSDATFPARRARVACRLLSPVDTPTTAARTYSSESLLASITVAICGSPSVGFPQFPRKPFVGLPVPGDNGADAACWVSRYCGLPGSGSQVAFAAGGTVALPLHVSYSPAQATLPALSRARAAGWRRQRMGRRPRWTRGVGPDPGQAIVGVSALPRRL